MTAPPASPTDVLPGRTAFSLLGPVTAWRDAEELELGTPQQRALLALLLLAEGRPVPTAHAIERLWGGRPPRSAEGTLRTYVYRLRRALAAAGSAAELRSSPAGYALRVDDSTLDVEHLRELRAAARADLRRGDAVGAHRALREALDLPRGRPLSGLEGLGFDAERRMLEGELLDVHEELLDLELRLGPAAEALPELQHAVAEHPLRERLRELLMLALCRVGRETDALQAYEEGRQALDEALGVAPGAALRALHERIVRGDATLRADPAASAAPGGRARPAQLPAVLPDFVGRARELAELSSALAVPGAVVGLTGLGGMGKTALAVRVAHELAGSAPGGQLFLDLHGGGAGRTDPAAALASLLRAIGVADHDVPAGLDDRAALWRTAVRDERLVLVLDDVADGAQLRPLLPAAPGVVTVVTAQRRVLDVPGVRWTRLGPLHEEEGVELMERIVGAERVAGDPDCARRLVAACSAQPLAVRLAAARLADRPHWSLEEIERQLHDDLRQPVVMHEDCRIVDAPIERAEAGLTLRGRTAFHLLALADADTLDLELATALLGLDPVRARGQLEELVDAHLLTAEPGGTYRFFTLTQAFARRRALTRDPARAAAALERVRARRTPRVAHAASA